MQGASPNSSGKPGPVSFLDDPASLVYKLGVAPRKLCFAEQTLTPSMKLRRIGLLDAPVPPSQCV